MKRSEKLIERIRKELNIDLPSDTTIVRTRAGNRMLGSGAFSWFLYSPTNASISQFGSTETVSFLLTKKQLDSHEYPGVGHTEITYK